MLVDAGNIGGSKSKRRSFIANSKEHLSALRIGKRRHLRRQGFRVAHIHLELALAVLAKGDLGFRSLERVGKKVTAQGGNSFCENFPLLKGLRIGGILFFPPTLQT